MMGSKIDKEPHRKKAKCGASAFEHHVMDIVELQYPRPELLAVLFA
jgi:hypothetical protein